MSPEQTILSIAAVVVAIGSIVVGLYQLYRLFRRIDDAIGVDKDGKTLSDRMSRVEHQLWENGGSSLADRVNVIEAHAIKTSTEIEIIKHFVLGTQPASEAKPVVKRTRIKKAS
jgi:hypothetical protein